MFGYVRVRKGDLRVKEYEFYKAVYCGLCHHQKKLSRRLRYTLSYDTVFLALARMGISGEKASFLNKRCLVHPCKGCLTSPSLRYTAKASAVLLYEKLSDDIADEKGMKKLLARIFKKSAKKALRHADTEALSIRVKRYLYELSDLERENCPSVYPPAEVFGKLLGEVFAFDEENAFTEEEKNALYTLGYRTGRFIYILDAYADREDDARDGKYNPFNLSQTPLDDAAKAALITALDLEMVASREVLNENTVKDGGILAILENLVALGLPDVARSIIEKNEKLSKTDRKALR